MSVATMNGRPRKQLADQLDRMDGIIDALADALPEAVTDACREGARQSVKEALIEVLTHPDVRARLAPPAPQCPPPGPSAWFRLKARLAAVRQSTAAAVRPVVRAVAANVRRVAPAVTAASVAATVAWRFRAGLLAGLGAGALAAVVGYLAPPAIAAALSGIGGTITAFAVQATARAWMLTQRCPG